MSRSALFLLLAFATLVVHADPVFVADGVAIRGYDPVAYHIAGKPVPGKPEHAFTWQGAEWRFASAENRAKFVAEPARWAPQYGGYCAYGTARGYKVSTEPSAFALVDGKLYLNYSHPVQRTWNKDRPGYIRTADDEWRTLEAEPYVTDAESVARAKLR